MKVIRWFLSHLLLFVILFGAGYMLFSLSPYWLPSQTTESVTKSDSKAKVKSAAPIPTVAPLAEEKASITEINQPAVEEKVIQDDIVSETLVEKNTADALDAVAETKQKAEESLETVYAKNNLPESKVQSESEQQEVETSIVSPDIQTVEEVAVEEESADIKTVQQKQVEPQIEPAIADIEESSTKGKETVEKAEDAVVASVEVEAVAADIPEKATEERSAPITVEEVSQAVVAVVKTDVKTEIVEEAEEKAQEVKDELPVQESKQDSAPVTETLSSSDSPPVEVVVETTIIDSESVKPEQQDVVTTAEPEEPKGAETAVQPETVVISAPTTESAKIEETPVSEQTQAVIEVESEKQPKEEIPVEISVAQHQHTEPSAEPNAEQVTSVDKPADDELQQSVQELPKSEPVNGSVEEVPVSKQMPAVTEVTTETVAEQVTSLEKPADVETEQSEQELPKSESMAAVVEETQQEEIVASEVKIETESPSQSEAAVKDDEEVTIATLNPVAETLQLTHEAAKELAPEGEMESLVVTDVKNTQMEIVIAEAEQEKAPVEQQASLDITDEDASQPELESQVGNEQSKQGLVEEDATDTLVEPTADILADDKETSDEQAPSNDVSAADEQSEQSFQVSAQSQSSQLPEDKVVHEPVSAVQLDETAESKQQTVPEIKEDKQNEDSTPVVEELLGQEKKVEPDNIAEKSQAPEKADPLAAVFKARQEQLTEQLLAMLPVAPVTREEHTDMAMPDHEQYTRTMQQRIKKDRISILWRAARRALSSGNNTIAEKKYLQLIDLDPGKIEFYGELSNVYKAQKKEAEYYDMLVKVTGLLIKKKNISQSRALIEKISRYSKESARKLEDELTAMILDKQ